MKTNHSSIYRIFTSLILILTVFPHLSSQENTADIALPVRFGAFSEDIDNYGASPAGITDTVFFSSVARNLGMDVEEIELYNINNPLNSLSSLPRHQIRIHLATWTGNEYLALAVNHDPLGGGSYNKGGVYISYEPVSNTATRIDKYTGTDWWESFCGIGYDATSEKVYLLSRPTDGEAGQYLLSFPKNSLDTTRVGGENTFISTIDGSQVPSFRSIAISSDGLIYGFATDDCIYRIDKNTAQTSLVVKLDTDIDNYKTQSFFNLKTGELYLYKSQDYSADKIYSVDLSTGKTTAVAELTGTFYGIFHHYYTKDVPPYHVSNLEASYNLQTKETILTWTNPTENYNLEAIENLKTINIYKENADTKQMELIRSIAASGAGTTQSIEIKEESEGLFLYGIQTESSNGLKSYHMKTVYSPAYDLQVPYSLGFENNDNLTPLSLGGNAYLSNNKINDSIHTGSFALILPDEGDFLCINDIQLEKGCIYEFSYWVASQGSFTQSIDAVYVDDVLVSEHELFYDDNNYSKVTCQFAAEKYGPVKIKIVTHEHYSDFSGPLAIDDISIKQVSSNKTPAGLTDITCIPTKEGALSADISFTTPSTDAGDNTLTELTGIQVEYLQGKTFEILDTLEIHAIGEKIETIIPVNEPGRYTFRLTPFNQEGPSPFPTLLQESEWIGFDSIPMAPKTLSVQPNPDKTVTVKWSKVLPIGPENGYFGGEITGYEIIQKVDYEGSSYAISKIITESDSDTTCTFVADSINFYTYTVAAIRNNSNRGTTAFSYSLSGTGNRDKSLVNTDFNQCFDAPFHFNSYSKESSINQTIYLKEDIGEEMFIDTLYFFARLQNDHKVPFRILIDTTSMQSYEDKDNIIDYFQATEVFNDSLITKSQDRQQLAVPITPYFYNGQKNLVITIIKPLQDRIYTGGSYENFYGKPYLPTNRNIKIYSEDIDLDQISGFQELDSKIQQGIVSGNCDNYVPLTAASSVNGLSTIEGHIENALSGKPIPDANILITPDPENEIVFQHTIHTDDSGNFGFENLPYGKYTLTFHVDGFIDSISTFDIEPSQTKTFDIQLMEGKKINLSGTLVDENNKAIANADVKLKGSILELTTLTNESGEFRFPEIYNSSTYEITFSKRNLLEKRISITVPADNDTNIIVSMQVYPFEVSEISTNEIEEGLEISWKQPENLDNEKVIPTLGYNVYRFADANIDAKGTLLTETPVMTEKFVDEDYKEMQPSMLRYAVEAIYSEDNISKACYSDTVYKDLLFNVTIKIITDGASAENAKIRMVQQDIHGQDIYEGIASQNGIFEIKNCFRGTYNVTVELDYHPSCNFSFQVESDTMVTSPLMTENIATPSIQEITIGPEPGNVFLAWTLPEMDIEDMQKAVNPRGFKLYADNKIIDSIPNDKKEFTYTGLFSGEHIIAVSALYAGKESTLADSTIQGVHNLTECITENVRLYPNPSKNGDFHIIAPLNSMVTIFNIHGQMVKSFTTESDDQQFHLDHDGTYVILVHTGSNQYLIKAIR